MVPLTLKRGRFRAPGKLIASLQSTQNMLSVWSRGAYDLRFGLINPKILLDIEDDEVRLRAHLLYFRF
jgi:hypothetical protein